MATPIPADLRRALSRSHPEPWVDHVLGSFPPEYLGRYDADALSRHLGLIRELGADHPIRVQAEPVDDLGTWRVEIVGYDAFQLLSTVCSLLAIYRLSVIEARIFTSDPPEEETAHQQARLRPKGPGGRPVLGPGSGFGRPGPPRPSRGPVGPDRRRKIVDVFLVRPVEGAGVPNWKAFEEELADLAQRLRQGQHDEVHHRLIGRFALALGDRQEPGGPLDAISLEITPGGLDRPTRVDIQARDSFGFLSLTAGALALSGLRIVRADVRTDPEGGFADDTLWITDRSGKPVVEPDRVLALKYALILIEHFSSRLPGATDPEAALVHFSRFANDLMARPDRAQEFASLDRPEVLDALVRVLGESRFLWEDYLLAQPENVLPLIGNPERWARSPDQDELAADLADRLDRATDLDSRVRALRRFKDREIFRADVRTILGLSGGPEGFANELTEVAEVVIAATLELAAERLNTAPPLRSDGRPVPVSVCALGKFGGQELGFASDLELMVVWDDREIADRPDQTPASDYFDRLVAGLRQVLGIRHGATFEPDFRLRPYGKGGPPATALSLFESYYQAGGAAWSYERQALIRLRAVAGDPELGRLLECLRDRFVFGPEPFDLDGLKKMREQQVRQLVRPGTVNAKLSPGALVDIEYAVQALQITFGRTDPALRAPSTLSAIDALEATGRLDPTTAATLRQGCRFFRSLIGALRVVRGNAEDLTVPSQESEDFSLLARRLRLDSPEALRCRIEERLRETRSAVDRALSMVG
jgi:glutamate-ammonia-ligase adenylyltransferase